MKRSNKIISIISLLLISMMMLIGCGTEKAITMTDREGNEFTLPDKVERIVSTAPSNTEVLLELGLGDKLVCVDKYSADIEGINEDLPKIDFRNPDAEAIIELNPDIIIASGHNKTGDEDPYALLKEAGIQVVYIPSSTSLEGIYEDIEFIANITGTEEEGARIIKEMKSEVEAIGKIGSTIENKKKVYFEIGAGSGLYTFGNDTFLNEILELVGSENIFADQSSWITVTPEAVLEANPDVILANTPGTNEEGKTAVEDIMSRDGWDTITAVKDGDVYEVDKNTTSRPSQNVVKAIKEIAKKIYPDEFKDIK